MTVLIWIAYAFAMLALFGMQTWLPALFMKKGFSVPRSFSYALVPQCTIVFGTLILGWVMDHFGRKQGLVLWFLLGAVTTFSFSLIHNQIGFYIIGICWGLTGGACITGLQVLPGESYPTKLRSTGAGWAVAAGRAGSIGGPLLGGLLQMTGFSFNQFFIIFALPALICATMVLLFPINIKGESLEAVEAKLAQRPAAGH
jgi:MFS family permease